MPGVFSDCYEGNWSTLGLYSDAGDYDAGDGLLCTALPQTIPQQFFRSSEDVAKRS